MKWAHLHLSFEGRPQNCIKIEFSSLLMSPQLNTKARWPVSEHTHQAVAQHLLDHQWDELDLKGLLRELEMTWIINIWTGEQHWSCFQPPVQPPSPGCVVSCSHLQSRGTRKPHCGHQVIQPGMLLLAHSKKHLWDVTFQSQAQSLRALEPPEGLHIPSADWLLYYLILSLMFWSMKFFQLFKHFLGSCT